MTIKLSLHYLYSNLRPVEEGHLSSVHSTESARTVQLGCAFHGCLFLFCRFFPASSASSLIRFITPQISHGDCTRSSPVSSGARAEGSQSGPKVSVTGRPAFRDLQLVPVIPGVLFSALFPSLWACLVGGLGPVELSPCLTCFALACFSAWMFRSQGSVDPYWGSEKAVRSSKKAVTKG